MKEIYIIAHTREYIELTIEVYFTPENTVRRIGELVDDGFDKPTPDLCPQEYLNAWDDFDNDGCEKKAMIELEILEI